MQKGCSLFVLLLCTIVIGVLAYLLGKKSGTKTIDTIALNAAFIAADENRPVDMSHILRAARSEYMKLEKSFTPL